MRRSASGRQHCQKLHEPLPGRSSWHVKQYHAGSKPGDIEAAPARGACSFCTARPSRAYPANRYARKVANRTPCSPRRIPLGRSGCREWVTEVDGNMAYHRPRKLLDHMRLVRYDLVAARSAGIRRTWRPRRPADWPDRSVGASCEDRRRQATSPISSPCRKEKLAARIFTTIREGTARCRRGYRTKARTSALRKPSRIAGLVTWESRYMHNTKLRTAHRVDGCPVLFLRR